MKNKFAIFNVALMLVVLFTTSYQSLHIVNHAKTDFATPKYFSGLHQYDLNHENHFHVNADEDDCEICTFNFSFFVAPQVFFFPLPQPPLTIPYQYHVQVTPQFFAGSLFSHRGPPLKLV